MKNWVFLRLEEASDEKNIYIIENHKFCTTVEKVKGIKKI